MHGKRPTTPFLNHGNTTKTRTLLYLGSHFCSGQPLPKSGLQVMEQADLLSLSFVPWWKRMAVGKGLAFSRRHSSVISWVEMRRRRPVLIWEQSVLGESGPGHFFKERQYPATLGCSVTASSGLLLRGCNFSCPIFILRLQILSQEWRWKRWLFSS